jgi:elongation factor P--beta-lysine ligase
LNARLRAFMNERGVIEVETPVLSRGAPLDPGVESWRAVAPDGAAGYLQTSPEYPMKRLLAAGAGDIYQLARVFRGEEQGVRHNPEFSLLEWYRLGFDDKRLADELVELVQVVAAADPAGFIHSRRFAGSAMPSFSRTRSGWIRSRVPKRNARRPPRNRASPSPEISIATAGSMP